MGFGVEREREMWSFILCVLGERGIGCNNKKEVRFPLF